MDTRLNDVLYEIRRTLAVMGLDLKKLNPSFEIYAAEAAPVVTKVYASEGSLLVSIGLSVSAWRDESASDKEAIDKYRVSLAEIRELALKAKDALGSFY